MSFETPKFLISFLFADNLSLRLCSSKSFLAICSCKSLRSLSNAFLDHSSFLDLYSSNFSFIFCFLVSLSSFDASIAFNSSLNCILAYFVTSLFASLVNSILLNSSDFKVSSFFSKFNFSSRFLFSDWERIKFNSSFGSIPESFIKLRCILKSSSINGFTFESLKFCRIFASMRWGNPGISNPLNKSDHFPSAFKFCSKVTRYPS